MSSAPRLTGTVVSLLLSIACTALLVATQARAFPFPASPETVVEYYNVHLDHYFLTINATEMAAIDAGAAGPGWVRTGHGFRAYPHPVMSGSFCSGSCGEPVKRFHGTPGLGPNSHFFTANPEEVAILNRPRTGWNLEGIAFTIHLPGAQGNCGTNGAPIVRLYNNRWMTNDSNHRYVTNETDRARMVAKGWVDEGVKFCSLGAVEVPIKAFRFNPLLRDGKIQPSAVCEDETRNLGPCMAVNNLPAPTTPMAQMGPPALGPTAQTLTYGMVTGFTSWFTYKAGPLPDEVAATTVFVQESDRSTYGIHVDTIQRGPAVLTSVNPLYQFKTTVTPGTPDTRVFPFGTTYETDAEISVKFIANVRTLKTRNAVSHAFGHPTLEFTDQRSGRNLYFTVITYGTVYDPAAPQGEYLAPDLGTGKVIVGTSFRDGSPYLRNFGRGTFGLPHQFVSADVWGEGGVFEFRMNKDEFQRVLDAARTIDGALSSNPADYLLDNYHFNNEVYGDGEIGMNLGGFRLEIVRR